MADNMEFREELAHAAYEAFHNPGAWDMRPEEDREAWRTFADRLLPVMQASSARAALALAEVRRLCEMTISISVRSQAIDQAIDTLDAIDRVMDDRAPAGRAS